MRTRTWLTLYAIIAILIALLLPQVQVVRWQGVKDLRVVFLVRDGDTGRPIADARLDVDQDGRENEGWPLFQLVTGADGTAARIVPDCRTSGVSGGFRNSWYICLPRWLVRASAISYARSDPLYLDTPWAHRMVERGSEEATLRINITLFRASSTAHLLQGAPAEAPAQ